LIFCLQLLARAGYEYTPTAYYTNFENTECQVMSKYPVELVINR